MILPSSFIAEGGTGNGTHNPSLVGATVFTLVVPNLPSNTVLTPGNFTGLKLGFGTQPDVTLRTDSGVPPDPPGSVPEPSTFAIAGFGALAFAGYCLRKRFKK
jgi:hypothetical protein